MRCVGGDILTQRVFFERKKKEIFFWPSSSTPRIRADPANPKQLRVSKEKTKIKMDAEGWQKEVLKLSGDERVLEESDNLKSVHRMYSGSSDALRSSDSGQEPELGTFFLHLGPGLGRVWCFSFFFFLTFCFCLVHRAPM